MKSSNNEDQELAGVTTELERQEQGLVLDGSILSRQALELLGQLASYGIYGQTSEEVAGRFIDAALVERLPLLMANRKKH